MSSRNLQSSKRSLTMKSNRSVPVAFLCAFGSVAGCAATPPPRELVDARAAYQHAASGQAAQLDPTSLHIAKTALDTAERANSEDPTSESTRDYAYIAGRKAQLAEVQAAIVAEAKAKAQAGADTVALQARGLQNAQGDLKWSNAQLAQTSTQLAMSKEQLATEQAARAAADKRAKEAMDKLAMAAALAVKEEPRGTVITLPGNVLFATNKAELLPAAQAKLAQVADALKNQDDHAMVVEGHTDSQGTEAANLDLGQRRAQSVRDYLVSRGVSADKISASGVGQGRPIADNKTVDGRAQNRRVEIVVQPIEKR
jgi:outer membrane protein OmpA-like peptidoglycan-associated protein